MAETSKGQLSEGLGAKPTGVPAIVLIRAGGDKPPLFLIHGVDGTLERFQYLVRQLEPDQPIYGVLSQALLGEPVALMRVEQLATYYIQAIRALRPHGPYHFLGFSFGGLLAFEMAQQLHARSDLVGMLGMLDTLKMGPGTSTQALAQSQSDGTHRSSLAAYHLRRVASPQGLSYAKDKLAARSLRVIYSFLCARGRPIPRFLRRAGDINWFAAVNYTPQSYAGGVTHFQTSASANDPRSTNEVWNRLAGRGVEVKLIPGRHEDVLDEPHAESLAHAITECLAKHSLLVS